uniref:Calpain catalytic domain-containing protein n=1 Tax=Pundamilia nyererei TaxID=303518 RepID=A0A3B4F5S0_9CICH
MPPPGVCMNIISARHMKNGYGTVTNPERFLNQDFHQLKQYCLIQHLRYIDEMFPPDRNSIGNGILTPSDLDRVVWLRPGKIVPNPSFVADGVSRFDFGQGWVKNCWFIASIGALTFQNHIFGQVVPLEQNFHEDYCGLFHFRFWRFGKWVDVIIDDKLPTIDGRLIFVHSRDPTEFWPALLEKAYAKVCGSYTDMNAGTPAEALVDFTGGVHIYIDLSKPPPDLWEMMCRAGQSKSLMGCGTPQGVSIDLHHIKQHAAFRGQMVNLVRLWNPWGHGEWNGDWSDRTHYYLTLYLFSRMSLKDFCKTYSKLDICCMCPDFLDGNSTCHWKTSIYEGRWVAGTTAGGCMKNPESFWTNPQYRVKIDELSSECAGKQGEVNMLVSLMQKPDKRNRRLVQNLYIGFSVFEVKISLYSRLYIQSSSKTCLFLISPSLFCFSEMSQCC